MKHPYTPGHDCPRCNRERARRDAQADASPRRWAPIEPGRRYRGGPAKTRRPVPGSQEWAETRGDDID